MGPPLANSRTRAEAQVFLPANLLLHGSRNRALGQRGPGFYRRSVNPLDDDTIGSEAALAPGR